MSSFRLRQTRRAREHPINDAHKLWATWFWGCIAHHFPGTVSGPVHPTLAREFAAGRDAARAGFVKIGDRTEAIELARFVEAGNPPHAYRGDQLGMAL